MDMVHDDKPPRYGNVVAWVRLAGLEMLYVVVDDVRVFALVVGAACEPTKACVADGALSLPAELASATTTMFNGDAASVNGTVMVAINELMELVTPDTTELSDAFRTCTAVTPESTTLYVMLAV
jgi:hypothetical protein